MIVKVLGSKLIKAIDKHIELIDAKLGLLKDKPQKMDTLLNMEAEALDEKNELEIIKRNLDPDEVYDLTLNELVYFKP